MNYNYRSVSVEIEPPLLSDANDLVPAMAEHNARLRYSNPEVMTKFITEQIAPVIDAIFYNTYFSDSRSVSKSQDLIAGMLFDQATEPRTVKIH